ncbi:hypothetical protein MRS44_018492 [Fusarium solani]|uniref:uncharacterized protein n=1 Tax=Fusarium solani TaxID=169388 RepID=UPI0032C3F2D5|nr:hypothetical protein MRS44_018492 [Fusarium solani]
MKARRRVMEWVKWVLKNQYYWVPSPGAQGYLGIRVPMSQSPTVRAFIKDLEHEAAVYERLKPIQGVYVPVFLGAIDLRSMNKIYYYDHRVYVVHMTFLSWGGCNIDKAQNIGDINRSLEDEAIRSLRAMHREG